MGGRRVLRLSLALVAVVFGAAACADERACAGDVCTAGTVRHVTGPAAAAEWAVQGDDGATYALVSGVPPLFRQDGLRVRLVARERLDGDGDARVVDAVSIETL